LTAPEIAALKAKEEAEVSAKPRPEVGPGGDSVSGTSPSEGGEDTTGRLPTKPVGKGPSASASQGPVDMDWNWAG
jgi:hypothetical protein